MSLWKVRVRRTVESYDTVDIEADTWDEAMKKGVDVARKWNASGWETQEPAYIRATSAIEQ